MKNQLNCINPVVTKGNIAYPCGKCQLCLQRKMREWSIRGGHELITHERKAVYVTLTYAPQYLPKVESPKFRKLHPEDAGGNLRPDDLKNYFKKLRKKLDKLNYKIKYIACGEYGGETWRPHYHAIIYGISYSKEIEVLLKETWGMGHVQVDKEKLSMKAIQYVLQYVRKKIEDKADNEMLDEIGRVRPFQRQSQGIGRLWSEKNRAKWVADGHIRLENVQAAVPRYYIKRLYIDEGYKIKYTSKVHYIYEGQDKITKVNTNNYKTIINLDGRYSREVFKQRCNAKFKTLDWIKKTYPDFNINYAWFRNVYAGENRNKIRQTRHEYKLYTHIRTTSRTEKEFLQRLHQHFDTESTRQGTPENGHYKRHKRRFSEELISLETQKKMENIAYAKELELLTSPFGYRNKVARALDIMEKTEYNMRC